MEYYAEETEKKEYRPQFGYGFRPAEDAEFIKTGFAHVQYNLYGEAVDDRDVKKDGEEDADEVNGLMLPRPLRRAAITLLLVLIVTAAILTGLFLSGRDQAPVETRQESAVFPV